MIKVGYNIDKQTLRNRFLEVFALTELEKGWKPFRTMFGVDLNELLTADFDKLVDLYLRYKRVSEGLPKTHIAYLDALFDYEYYQPKLAWFFMNPDNKFDFSTCHYCNMAYVNTYGWGDTYGSVLKFINNASREEWRFWFEKDVLPDNNLESILRERPYNSLEAFNSKKYLWKKIEKYKRMVLTKDANQFDLDHVLPKAICPITRLSLFNLVPSCQVCNEKLKKDKELAQSKIDWLKVSPTWSGNLFDQDVTIRLIPEVSCTTFFELRKNRENYRLDFDMPHGVYDNYVDLFRLHDRYNYHKPLALQILDLKERYSDEKVKEISRMLSNGAGKDDKTIYSVAQVKEDIFQMDFSKDRCFSKLRKDMMERN